VDKVVVGLEEDQEPDMILLPMVKMAKETDMVETQTLLVALATAGVEAQRHLVELKNIQVMDGVNQEMARL
jgi:hypothetical protein